MNIKVVHVFVFISLLALSTFLLTHTRAAYAERTEVAYNHMEYMAIRNAALAIRSICWQNSIKEEAANFSHNWGNKGRDSRMDAIREFRQYVVDGPLYESRFCYYQATNLSSPFRPSSLVGGKFRIIPDKACVDRNEGGHMGRRRWATCAAYCFDNPKCISFEMGKIRGGRDRICTISHSCTEEEAVSSRKYDLWIIRR